MQFFCGEAGHQALSHGDASPITHLAHLQGEAQQPLLPRHFWLLLPLLPLQRCQERAEAPFSDVVVCGVRGQSGTSSVGAGGDKPPHPLHSQVRFRLRSARFPGMIMLPWCCLASSSSGCSGLAGAGAWTQGGP